MHEASQAIGLNEATTERGQDLLSQSRTEAGQVIDLEAKHALIDKELHRRHLSNPFEVRGVCIPTSSAPRDPETLPRVVVMGILWLDPLPSAGCKVFTTSQSLRLQHQSILGSTCTFAASRGPGLAVSDSSALTRTPSFRRSGFFHQAVEATRHSHRSQLDLGYHDTEYSRTVSRGCHSLAVERPVLR